MTFLGRRILRSIIPKPLALRLRQEWIARRVSSGGGHLENEVHVLPALVGPSAVCWDIGANVGMYTVALARLAKEVIAFEPVPHNLNTLRQVVRRAGLTNVSIRPLAMGDATGHARFTVPANEGFYGGYYLAQFDAQGELEVQVDTIDRLIASGVPEPDFIKCDVEGAEMKVIDGARQLIARRHPIWLLETFEPDVLHMMESLGYLSYIRTEANSLERVTAHRAATRNYFLLPPGATAVRTR